jgi:hypothetical protein
MGSSALLLGDALDRLGCDFGTAAPAAAPVDPMVTLPDRQLVYKPSIASAPLQRVKFTVQAESGVGRLN